MSQIERVDITPKKEVYFPGEVLYVSLHFRDPFVGECEIGLSGSSSDGFPTTACRQSTTRLYEGQIYIKDDLVGPRYLKAVLTPVKGARSTIAAGDRVFHVRPVAP